MLLVNLKTGGTIIVIAKTTIKSPAISCIQARNLVDLGGQDGDGIRDSLITYATPIEARKAGLLPKNEGKNQTDEEGFEPPEPYGSTVFKTVAINHSATHPVIFNLIV